VRPGGRQKTAAGRKQRQAEKSHPMLKGIAPRLIGSLVLLVIVPTVTFFVQGVASPNAARTVLGLNASPAQVDAFNHRLGLDQALIVRYLDWLGGAVHGDLGVSYVTGQSVQSILAPRLGVSLSLIIGSVLVFTVAGIVLGVLSATGGRIVGQVVDGVSAIGVAVPNFWLAVILITVCAVQLPLFPATGYVPFAQDPGMWLSSLVLPVIALAFGGVTAVAKQTRDQMLLAVSSPYARTLRANGASEFSLVYKHALRNAAGPVVTVLGIIFVGALSGTVIIENIFVLPGLGSQALQSSLQADLPVIQGISLYFTVIVVIVNVLVDIANAILNPKVRAS
jgi:peptide/nickel transport system permease protein